MIESLYQVDMGYCCAGVVVNEQNKIIAAAPILTKWAMGRDWNQFQDWVFKRHGKIVLAGREETF